MTSAVGDSHLPELFYGTCGWFCYHEYPPSVKAFFASCPVSLCLNTSVYSEHWNGDRTTTIIDGTPQIHCSDLELLPCARTSVTRSCHGLAPLHVPLSKRATATLAPIYTFPRDWNIPRYIVQKLNSTLHAEVQLSALFLSAGVWCCLRPF
jgi:hypothetical protein